ncbi:hypothetical protein, partial [Escherichia coli]|uniref:hypothetical protein n=1 Tax=Escherichia coli TaxID=562 RepID=UPI0035C1DB27
MKTVNGTRNPFAGREALDKRSASVFPALTRDRFLRQFIFQCHNCLINSRGGDEVPDEEGKRGGEGKRGEGGGGGR